MASISTLRTGAVKEITRWFTLFEDRYVTGANGEAIELPAFELLVRYVTDQELQNLLKDFRGRENWITDKGFRRIYFRRCVQDWRGLTRENLNRFGEYFMLRPEMTMQFDDVIAMPKDDADLHYFIDGMSQGHFNAILEASRSLEAYAIARIEQEKKEQPPSPDSV